MGAGGLICLSVPQWSGIFHMLELLSAMSFPPTEASG